MGSRRHSLTGASVPLPLAALGAEGAYAHEMTTGAASSQLHTEDEIAALLEVSHLTHPRLLSLVVGDRPPLGGFRRP